MMRRIAFLTGLAMVVPTAPAAQEPPIGIAEPALEQDEYVFDTAEVHPIRVSVLAKDFPRPFGMAFLPNGDLLVGARYGGLMVLRDATGTPGAMEEISGMPLVTVDGGQLGLLDIALHPEFADNRLVYFTFNDAPPEGFEYNVRGRGGTFTIKRGRLEGNELRDVETVFSAGPSRSSGSRIAFAPDGTLYASTAAPFNEEAQDPSSIYGKVLRLNDDGSIPADNPFVDVEGAHPAIWTMGHRDQHGLVVDPDSGTVFAAEHGPNGGDELNLIERGANYGWPDYSFGREYDGQKIGTAMQGEGITDPTVIWLPSIAISGLMLYKGDAFPEWQDNIFVASAQRGEVRYTGGLERVVFGENYGEIRRETLLTQLNMRVRQAVTGPDGNIYVILDGPTNAVLRISPGE